MSDSHLDSDAGSKPADRRFTKTTIWAMLGLSFVLGLVGIQRWIESPAPEVQVAENVTSALDSPLGQVSYDRLLSRKAGTEMSGADLARRAAERCSELEVELEQLAIQLDGTDWRQVFATLSLDHPPTREAVLETYRLEIERARVAVVELDLVALPERVVTVTEIHNPAFQQYFSLAMYLDGRLAVTLGSSDLVSSQDLSSGTGSTDNPNEYLRNHCRICIPPLAVHEVYPGHHVAFERVIQELDDPIARRVVNRRQGIYHEGWGLYAEQLMLEQGYYESTERRFGALRMLYLRALRAWIDPLLHSGELDRSEAERWYREKALMTPSAARSEVDRHLKDPVMKASYFVGLEQILQLRGLWRERNPEVPLKTFHNRFLGRPRAIPEVAQSAFGLELVGPF